MYITTTDASGGTVKDMIYFQRNWAIPLFQLRTVSTGQWARQATS